MPNTPEFISIIHNLSSGVDELCTTIDGILSRNDANTIVVPVTVLESVLAILRAQTHITNRLLEENATILDLVDTAVRNLKK